MSFLRFGWLGALTLVATTPTVQAHWSAQLAEALAEQAAARQDDASQASEDAPSTEDPASEESSSRPAQIGAVDVWTGSDGRSATSSTGPSLIADLLSPTPRSQPIPLPLSSPALTINVDDLICQQHVWISCCFANAPPTL